MSLHSFTLAYSPLDGLTLNAALVDGLEFRGCPVRVVLAGSATFYVWGMFGGDSGENAPRWAEPELQLTLFGPAAMAPEARYTVESFSTASAGEGYRVTGVHPRVTAVLEVRLLGGELQTTLHVENPPHAAARPLPLAKVELQLAAWQVGEDATFLSAHPYGGRTFSSGRCAALPESGVQFVHGCIGLALPLVCLSRPATQTGIAIEFMLDGRPELWLRPGSTPEQVNMTLGWMPSRLLGVGQMHGFGGTLRLTPFTGEPVGALRAWRDAAAERYGLLSPPTPDWAQRMQIIEFWLYPDHGETPFDRLDDPRLFETMKNWRDLGFTAIFCVGYFTTGIHMLSPLDYLPAARAGGVEAERQFLQWAHELGLHAFLWVTTVGVDRHAPMVQQHPDWFTHRVNGELFYAWDSRPETDFLGYAPDADPLSAEWRAWLEAQATGVIARGYDGIMIDGCIPRADNHARWAWPGEGRNSVEPQVRRLTQVVREQGNGLITLVEDGSLAIQAMAEVMVGRYDCLPPYHMQAYWDLGMGGGPTVATTAPPAIAPELARDYLRIRLASLLPGAVSNDGLVDASTPPRRPWAAQSLLSGMSATMRHGAKLAAIQQDCPELLALLRFCQDEPLVHDAPVSIDGVRVTGDAAVVGLLRPGTTRCLLTLIQFADRPATVQVTLAPPEDVPAIERAAAGSPEAARWALQEVCASATDTALPAGDSISAENACTIALTPYSFRVFALTRE